MGTLGRPLDRVIEYASDSYAELLPGAACKSCFLDSEDEEAWGRAGRGGGAREVPCVLGSCGTGGRWRYARSKPYLGLE